MRSSVISQTDRDEISLYHGLWRQVLGQRLPLAARRQRVENAVQNLAHMDRALSAAVLRGWDHGLMVKPGLRYAPEPDCPPFRKIPAVAIQALLLRFEYARPTV